MKKLIMLVFLICLCALPAYSQNLVVLQNAATATGNGAWLPVRQSSTPNGAVAQVTGTFSATITWEATINGTDWVAVLGTNLSTGTQASTATAAGIYTFSIPRAEHFRARISAYSSGSVTVEASAAPGFVSRSSASGGGGITSLEGQTGATQVFTDDTNITIASAADAHVIGWAGTLAVARGGSGAGSLTGLLLGNGTSAFTAITTSAGLAGVISDETGTNKLVYSDSPTLVTPALGTPSSGTLTNATGLPPAGIVGWPANASGVLTNDGAGALSWGAAGGAPGGSDTQVQFNDSSAFGGDAGLTYNKTTNALTITSGFISVPGAGADSERFGSAATATGARATVVGKAPNAGSNTDIVLIGDNPTGNGGFSVGIGHGAVVAAGAVAIGYNPSANVAQAIAIGNGAVSVGGITVGRASSAGASTTVLVGDSLTSTAITQSILLGNSISDGGTPTAQLGGFFKNAAGVAEIGNGTIGQWGSLKVGVRDAGTTTITNGLFVGHQSTGTPAAGLGSAILYRINSSTTADQDAAQTAALWTTATHASRTADWVLSLTSSGAALAEVFRVKANALIVQPQTVTAGGTTGAQTIDKPAGTVNIAAGQTALVVTNALVTASSQCFVVVRTADTTSQIKNVVPTTGSFTINLVSAATAETSLGFWCMNQ
jgi:hypothetical protein